MHLGPSGSFWEHLGAFGTCWGILGASLHNYTSATQCESESGSGSESEHEPESDFEPEPEFLRRKLTGCNSDGVYFHGGNVIALTNSNHSVAHLQVLSENPNHNHKYMSQTQ